MASPLELNPPYRPPPGLSDMEALRSCAPGRRVLIPFNLCNGHWLLGEADLARGLLTLFDSNVTSTDRHRHLLTLVEERAQAAATSLGWYAGAWTAHLAPSHQQHPLSNDCLIHTVATMFIRV